MENNNNNLITINPIKKFKENAFFNIKTTKLDLNCFYFLEEGKILNIKNKINNEEVFCNLSDIVEIKRGLQTGIDEFFVISKEKALELLKHDKYKEIVLPCVRGSDTIDKITEECIENYLIFFPKGFTNKKLNGKTKTNVALEFMYDSYNEVFQEWFTSDKIDKFVNRTGSATGDYFWELGKTPSHFKDTTFVQMELGKTFKLQRLPSGYIPLSTCVCFSCSDEIAHMMNTTFLTLLFDKMFASNFMGGKSRKTITNLKKIRVPKKQDKTLTVDMLEELYGISESDLSTL